MRKSPSIKNPLVYLDNMYLSHLQGNTPGRQASGSNSSPETSAAPSSISERQGRATLRCEAAQREGECVALGRESAPMVDEPSIENASPLQGRDPPQILSPGLGGHGQASGAAGLDIGIPLGDVSLPAPPSAHEASVEVDLYLPD